MVNSIRRQLSCVNPLVDRGICFLTFCTLNFLAATSFAQQLPSNVYRPPTDNFNQGNQRIIYPQRQVYQQGQPSQAIPQYQPVPSTQQFYYPQQNSTPIYQQPIQEVPGQVIPSQVQTAPAENNTEMDKLKRSLVKARDLMQKYQLKLEDVTRQNQELESQITTLQQAGDMSNPDDSQELATARAAASEAQQQMSELKNQLQNTLTDLQTSTADVERQKQVSAGLQQQIVELQKSVQMAAGSDEQVTQLTENMQRFKSQNDELTGQVTTLQNALREKETQIANMVSSENSEFGDLKELLEESETNNKELGMRLKEAEAKAAEMSAPQTDPALDQLRADNQQLSLKLKEAEAKAAEMTAPQTDPAIDQLRADNQQLVQVNQQLEAEKVQLNNVLGNLRSQNSELDATVTRLSNMAPPAESAGFAAAAPSADLTGLQNQLASVTRRNGQLKRQLKLSKSKYASLDAENVRLGKAADAKSSIEVAAAPAPVAVKPVALDVAPVTAAIPELGLNSVSGGWPVKYWIFGMLGIGLAVGLAVAWYESVVDPKGLRRSTHSTSNQ